MYTLAVEGNSYGVIGGHLVCPTHKQVLSHHIYTPSRGKKKVLNKSKATKVHMHAQHYKSAHACPTF